MKGIDKQNAGRRIADRAAQQDVRPDEQPWKKQAPDEVKRIRSAVTNRPDGPRVSDEMAPMMSEFLARLDDMQETPPLKHQPPRPARREPLTPVQVAEAAGAAVDLIEQSEFGSRMRDDGPVAEMIAEVKDFLRLRRACIARSTSSSAQ
ncbi:MAG: hypothetical protein ACQEVA_03285 [Myxococcota bacterium]